MPIRKVVIWGHPLHSHTHSYVHEGFHRAFASLGYETYWLDDRDDVSGIDFSGALVLTEGQVDRRVPMRRDCHYVLHNCDWSRYDGVDGRRLALQVYTDAARAGGGTEIAPFTFLDGHCLVQPWATDLLPDEIDLEWASRGRGRRVHWVGTIGGGRFGNIREIEPFRRACADRGVPFIQRGGVPRARHIALIQESWLAPAIHGTWQVENGYIACRVFKNISYGQMGLTNSAAANALFDGQLVYAADTRDLLDRAEAVLRDGDAWVTRTRELMTIVRARHTYVNRIESILSVLS